MPDIKVCKILPITLYFEQNLPIVRALSAKSEPLQHNDDLIMIDAGQETVTCC